jgi:hypothetical protein
MCADRGPDVSNKSVSSETPVGCLSDHLPDLRFLKDSHWKTAEEFGNESNRMLEFSVLSTLWCQSFCSAACSEEIPDCVFIT